MKTSILLIVCLFLFAGCGKKNDSSSQQSKTETTEKKTDTTSTEKITPEEGSAKSKQTNTDGIEKHKFNKNDLPSSIKYKGKIVEGASWTDKNGDNILIITQTDVRNINADEREQYLYGYHYVNHDDGYTQLWTITDYVKSYCDVDAKYYPNTLEIEDVDGDGIAESVFCYQLDGRCDVSPLDVKLMMHSGDTKLVIRGTIGFNPQNGHKTKGDKKFDDAFKSANPLFKDYASKKWDEFVNNFKD